MKKLPEIQKNGAMRESIGELENIKQLLLKEKESKSDLEKRLKVRNGLFFSTHNKGLIDDIHVFSRTEIRIRTKQKIINSRWSGYLI